MSNLSALQEFSALKQKCRALGVFERSHARALGEVAVIVGLFVAAAVLRPSLPWIAFFMASAAGISLVWWIHDTGHDAHFETKKTSKFWIEALGITFLGMPQIEYHFEVHRRHHGFTNVIGKDGALDTGPVIWHRKMLPPGRDKAFPYQAALWYVFALPLTWPLINQRCIRTLIERRNWGRLAALSLRWALVLWFFEFDMVFVVGPILITGFVLGFSASLNHFHMPIDDKAQAPFPASVFLTTQNLASRSRLATWLTGGLNFHIEHHLFPTVPSRKLHLIAPLAEEFARENGLPYHLCSTREAVSRLTARLRDPVSDGNSKLAPVTLKDELTLSKRTGANA